MIYAWFALFKDTDVFSHRETYPWKKYLIRENCHSKTCGGDQYLKSTYGAK